MSSIILHLIVLLITVSLIYAIYLLIGYYAVQVRYLTFIEDLTLDNKETLILRLSSKFWFSSFALKTDRKTLNLVLRKISHIIKERTSLETRPYVFGEALANLSTINKKCETRAIQYVTKLTLLTNNAHFIICLMECNPKIQGRHFVKILKSLPKAPRDELIKFLQTDPSAKRLLVFI